MQSNDLIPFVTLVAQAKTTSLYIQDLQKCFDSNTVVWADTFDDTLAAVGNRQFDLIIIDLKLKGLDIIANIKAPDGINCTTPVIALIEIDEVNERKNIIKQGFDDCLVKPLSAYNLEETIAFWRGDNNWATYQESIQTLLANCRNNRTLAATLYKKLLETLPQQIDRIENALQAGDYSSIADSAHTLNGCIKTCYLKPLAGIAQNLETCVIEKNYDLVDGYFLMLKQKVRTFIDFQQQILDYLEKE